MKRCSDCQAEIQLIENEEGKRVPFDTQPSPEGRFVLLQNRKGTANVAVKFMPGFHRALAPRFRPHAETCPVLARNATFDDYLAAKAER